MVIPGKVIATVGTATKSRSDDVSPLGMVVVLKSTSKVDNRVQDHWIDYNSLSSLCRCLG